MEFSFLIMMLLGISMFTLFDFGSDDEPEEVVDPDEPEEPDEPVSL